MSDQAVYACACFPFLITAVQASSQASLGHEQTTAFVSLSCAIVVVYGTLIFVYLCRYRVFSKSAARKQLDRKIDFGREKRMKSSHDQYAALNRFLHRLKANSDKELSER